MKIGQEGIFGHTVGQLSIHANTTSNGMRLIDFAAARNMVVCSTKFQHLDFYKAPDRPTLNQIDHNIDGRHVTSVLDVCTFRSPNIDSDHYLVAAKFLVHCESWTLRSCDQKRQLGRSPLNSQISSVVPYLISATLVDCGPTFSTPCTLLRKQPLVSSAYYSEINGTMRKNTAYKKTLRSAAKRAIVEKYREKRRRKKKEHERREREEFEMHRCRNGARKFYQKVKRLTEGYKLGASSCKDPC